VLIWELSDGGDRKICIILEGLITLMFMGEVAVQIVTEEWPSYWASWLNRLDLMVCSLCVFLYIVFASVEDAPHSHYSVANYMDAILVGIRYGMQAIRLLRFAQRGHENRKMLNQTEIVFDTHQTLNVLQLHGLHQRKDKRKKKKKKKSAFHKLTNRLFNPKLNSLLHRADSNELRTLKEKSNTPRESAIEMSNVDVNELGSESESDEMDDIGAPIVPSKQSRQSADDDGVLVRRSEVFTYSTDELEQTDSNVAQQFMDAYDSEQMRVYDDILQHAHTDETNAQSEDTMRIPF